jgi:hypothetical protein
MRLCSPNLRQATAAATCANTPLAAALGKVIPLTQSLPFEPFFLALTDPTSAQSSSNSHIHGRLSFSHTLLNHRAKRAGTQRK